jgi:hypothetical protein
MIHNWRGGCLANRRSRIMAERLMAGNAFSPSNLCAGFP